MTQGDILEQLLRERRAQELAAQLNMAVDKIMRLLEKNAIR